MTGLIQTSEETRPSDMLVGTPSTLGHEFAYSFDGASWPTVADINRYFCYTATFLSSYMLGYGFLLPLCFGWRLILGLYKDYTA